MQDPRPSPSDLKLDDIPRSSAFKYRILFIWHVIHTTTLPSIHDRRLFWLRIIEGPGADSETDLWLWMDESDEEYLGTLQLSATIQWHDEDWEDIASALRVRQLAQERRPSQPREALAHLSSPTRARVIAWFVTVAARRMSDRVDELIYRWGTTNLMSSKPWTAAGERCIHCFTPEPLLQMWTQTMMYVYSPRDIQSIPWRAPCECMVKSLGPFFMGIPELQKPVPTALPFIYELVVSPWPLILWVAFRISAHSGMDRTGRFRAFLDFLEGPTSRDIVAWDDEDASYLLRILVSHSMAGCWISSTWRARMHEVNLKDWSVIHTMTHVPARRRRTGSEASQLKNRLCALVLTVSPNFSISAMAGPEVLVPLRVNMAEEPFCCAEILIGQRKGDEDSLEERGQQQYCAAFFARSDATLLQRVEYLSVLAHCPVSPNLFEYTVTTLINRSASEKELEDLLHHVTQWADQGEIRSLIAYSSIVRSLVKFLSRSYSQGCFLDHLLDYHSISQTVVACLSDDLRLVAVRLGGLLSDQESRKDFLAFRDADAQALLDLLQILLDHDNILSIRSVLFDALRRLSDKSGLHPTCFTLTELQKIGHQVAAGGFGDVWKGVVRRQSVCVKVMRVFEESDVQAVLKEFGREALLWRQLWHPNLLPFYGVYHLENRLCIVSPWMENGNILQYVNKKSPSLDRRLSWILDVAQGMEYLHKNRIVHGDLKALNVLVTPSQRACIVDFGLASVAESVTLLFTYSSTSVRGGTARYQAPELLRAEKPNHYGSDVYAFAHVCYEILTGKVPFFKLTKDAAVMFKIFNGAQPERLPSCIGSPVMDHLWGLLQECWSQNLTKRPSAEQILQRLTGPLIQIQAANPRCETDWDNKFSSRFRRALELDPFLQVPSVARMEQMLFGDGVYNIDL